MTRRPQSILDVYDLESPYVTEFRRLLHKVLDQNSHKDLKSILLTSAMLAEGKSTVCSFMAITAAKKKGLKTLVIDADLRRPSIARLFGLTREPGLVEVLVDCFKPRDAIRKTEIDKLDILTSGRFCDAPAEVFDAEAIGSLINEMKFYYDLVLIDCAPLVPVSDPMLLASKVDGVLMVIKAGETPKEVARRAMDIVSPEKNNVLGVVLNNVTDSLPFYYDYGYYQYNARPVSSKKAGPAGSPPTSRRRRGNSSAKTITPTDDVSKST